MTSVIVGVLGSRFDDDGERGARDVVVVGVGIVMSLSKYVNEY